MSGPKAIDSSSLSVGELLRKPYSYKVPYYQRDYSWSKEHIETLWTDIVSSLEDGSDNEYFMGVIVIAPGESEKTRLIVDGQQRITSLSMIFSAISAEWEKRNEEVRSTGVSRDYLGSEDRRTGSIIPKLSLNETNDNFFQQIVLHRENISPHEKKLCAKTNKLILEAYTVITEKIRNWLDKFDDQESALLDFEEYISEKLNMIEIQVSDDSDAFIIFETLNDRGLDLAVADLVKNYLFSLGGKNIDKFKQAWVEISVLVGRENITQFLRHYWLAFHGLVRERDLYKEIKNYVKSRTLALQFLFDIRKSADHYSALSNTQHNYWREFDPAVIDYLEALALFRVSQFRPVAIAVMKKLEPVKVLKVLRDLMIISFRYTIVSGLGTGNLERVYSNAAISITKGDTNTSKKVFQKLKSAYVDAITFKESFINRQFGKSIISRFILAGLNDYIEENKEKEVSKSVSKINLEHILPQNPNEFWKNSFANMDEHSQWCDTIGNQTLIEKSLNRDIGNANFIEKKEKAYSKSDLALNVQLIKFTEWNISKIQERGNTLSEIAEKCWSVEY
jgi:hypothetical protein